MNEHDLLIAALQRRDPAERTAYLEQACAGNKALCRRVEMLLEAGTEVSEVPEKTFPLDRATASPDGTSTALAIDGAAGADPAGTLLLADGSGDAATIATENNARLDLPATLPIADGPGDAATIATENNARLDLPATLPLAGGPGDAASVETNVFSTEEKTEQDARHVQPTTLPVAGGPGNAPTDDTRLLPAGEDTDFAGTFGIPEVGGLSQFELLAELGRGGMGVVYKARHRQMNRIVALKMILDGKHAHPEHHERFRIEAEAVARLRHPNIVQIYDLGEADGCPFVTLELLEGGSLADRLKGTTQPGRAAAEIVATLAMAMHAAHQAGIIHRDLKPPNILFDRDGTPKITDFGLAKRLEVEDTRTQTGQIMGTPSYMAPEQAQGEVRRLGPPADIYALGAILYEMLTGRPPFKGSSPSATLYQVVYDDVLPPSRIEPQIARDLETICLKCLQKEPQKRYGSAEELADDLRRYLDNRPILARRTPLWERTAKWVRRHPTRAAMLAVGALIAGAALAAGLYLDAQGKRAGRIEDKRIAALAARSDQELFEAQAYQAKKRWPEAKFILNPLLADLKREPRLRTLYNRANDLLVQVNRGIQDDAHQQEDQRRHDVFLQRRNQALFLKTHYSGLDLPTNMQKTRAAAREALVVFAQPGPGPDDAWTLPPLPATLSPLDQAEIVEGCYELLLILSEAVAQPLPGEEPKLQAERGLQVLDRAARLRPESSRAFHVHRAACLDRAGDREGAARERTEADRFAPTTAADHFLAGQERYARGDWSGAAEAFDAVLRLQFDHFWAQCLSAICALQSQRSAEAKVGLNACLRREPNFVWLYLLRGFASGQVAAQALAAVEFYPARADDLRRGAESQFAAAEADYDTALKLLDDKPQDELRYILLVNRGQMRFQHQRLDEAVVDLREAIARNDRQYEAFSGLGAVYLRQKKWDAALEQFTQAIRLKPGWSPLYRERAKVQQYRDDPSPAQRAEALRDLDEAIAHEAPGNPIVASDQTRRGDLLRRMHRYDEALSACDAALKVVPDRDDTLRLRMMVLLDLKRYDEAIPACDAALAEGKRWPELHYFRGLARAGRQDFSGAIADYTLALEQRPDQPRVLVSRGLTYLVSDAPKLALGDFAAALRLDSSSGEAHAGRGTALVRLGDYRGAVVAAEESLRHPPATPRRAYSAARIYAQAAQAAGSEARQRGRDVVVLVNKYQDRAVVLALEALRQVPDGSRAEFWRNQIQTDPALRSLSPRLKFAVVAAPLTNE